jgi:hypothetical protein
MLLRPTAMIQSAASYPPPGKPIPVEYYESHNGNFVRADVTYLKQDFSVLIPVAEPGPWPAEQRYDFLVRQRPLTEAEVAGLGIAASSKPPSTRLGQRTRVYPQRDTVLLALRQLTGEDLGEQSEPWQRRFTAGQRAARP